MEMLRKSLIVNSFLFAAYAAASVVPVSIDDIISRYTNRAMRLHALTIELPQLLEPDWFRKTLLTQGVSSFFDRLSNVRGPAYLDDIIETLPGGVRRPLLHEDIAGYCGPYLDHDASDYERICLRSLAEFVEYRLPLLSRQPEQLSLNIASFSDSPDVLDKLVGIYVTISELTAPRLMTGRQQSSLEGSPSMLEFILRISTATDAMVSSWLASLRDSNREKLINLLQVLCPVLGTSSSVLSRAAYLIMKTGQKNTIERGQPLRSADGFNDPRVPGNLFLQAEHDMLGLDSNVPVKVVLGDKLLAIHHGMSAEQYASFKSKVQIVWTDPVKLQRLFRQYGGAQKIITCLVKDWGVDRFAFTEKWAYLSWNARLAMVVADQAKHESFMAARSAGLLRGYIRRHAQQHDNDPPLWLLGILSELFEKGSPQLSLEELIIEWAPKPVTPPRELQTSNQSRLASFISFCRSLLPTIPTLPSVFQTAYPPPLLPDQSPKRQRTEGGFACSSSDESPHYKESYLDLEAHDENVFAKSVAFFTSRDHFDTDDIRVIGGQRGKSESKWIEMIMNCPEIYLARPLNNSEFRFLGNFYRLVISKGLSLGVSFKLDLIVQLFFPAFVKEISDDEICENFTRLASSFQQGFHEYAREYHIPKISVKNIGALLLHGRSSARSSLLDNIIYPTKMRGWRLFTGAKVWGINANRRVFLFVERSNIVEDSISGIAKMIDIGQKRFIVHFDGEQGIDQGGPTRDFIRSVSEQIFSKSFGIFDRDEQGNLKLSKTAQLTSHREINSYLELAGFILRVAVDMRLSLGLTFSKVFLKSLMSMNVSQEDLFGLDSSKYKQIAIIEGRGEMQEFLLAREQVLSVEETREYRSVVDPQMFEIEHTLPFHQIQRIYFKRRGERIETEEDWEVYAHELRSLWVDESSAPQAMKKHFADLRLDLNSLEAIIKGEETFPVDQWRAVTIQGSRTGVMDMFWDILDELSELEKKKLFTFWTGMDRLPAGGFAAFGTPFHLKLNVVTTAAPCPRLIVSHTCSNQLDLPLARNKTELKASILGAIDEPLSFGLI